MEKMEGVVQFFTYKGWGKIKAENYSDDIFVHCSDIIGSNTLLENEKVIFNPKNSEKGKIAKNVERPDVKRGVVSKFSHVSGIIKDIESRKTYKVHFKDILDPHIKKRRLYPNEEVEFFCKRDPKRGDMAVKVVRLDPRSPFEKSFKFEDFESSIKELASIAQEESWDYENENSKYKYPVLRSYVRHTFNRLKEQNKIMEGDDKKGNRVALLNTALVTPFQEEIFAYFCKNYHKNTDWFFKDFYKNSDHKLSVFASRPEIASYFDNPSDLLYDTRINIVVNKEHIIKENIHRFPKIIQEYNTHAIVALLEGQIAQALKRVKRNYKTAVPQFHNGSIQLLLPLCLTTQDRADLALVVSKENKLYRGATILSLDMAYNNARLVARPDREWLDP